MPGYIYILHFDNRLEHAQHYAGCTTNLRARLHAHANGHGSRLTRTLRDIGIGWRLATLYTCSETAMRRLERRVKDCSNGPRFCNFCSGMPAAIAGATEYPIGMLPFATSSELLTLASDHKPHRAAKVRFTSPIEPPSTTEFIKHSMRREKDALGFIPCGGPEGIKLILDAGKIVIASINDQDVGYAGFTLSADGNKCNIHQAVINDDARLQGNGRAMIDAIAEAYPRCVLTAKVRDDLAANEFWTSIGFFHLRSSIHKTSQHVINQYARQPLFR